MSSKAHYGEAELVASMHAHTAVLTALCVSHPDPTALLAALDVTAEIEHRTLPQDGAVSGMFLAYTDAMRDLIRARIEPPAQP